MKQKEKEDKKKIKQLDKESESVLQEIMESKEKPTYKKPEKIIFDLSNPTVVPRSGGEAAIMAAVKKLKVPQLNEFLNKFNITPDSGGKESKEKAVSDYFKVKYLEKQGTGLRRRAIPMGRPNYDRTQNKMEFGDYMISFNDLHKNILRLYNYRNELVLNERIPSSIGYVLKDMLTGNYAINEHLTDSDYNKLKKILQFVKMPNPILHERRSRPIDKSDLLSLKRKFEILVGEYNAGNNSLGPEIVDVIKKMHKRGLINERLANEGIKMYKTPIIY
jgi:hypothetical protein